MPQIIDVHTDIDLPNNASPVTVSLESVGVGSVAFLMELKLGNSRIKTIEDMGSSDDLGKPYELENAITLRGLSFSCRGVAASPVPSTIKLHCAFRCGNKVIKSGIADIEFTAGKTSQVFRFTCPFI